LNLIGMPVEWAKQQLEQQGKKVVLQQNNFCIEGDRQLVTNVKEQNDQVVLVVGEFIFDIEKENYGNN
jgi:hypothetical protein